MTVKQQQEDPYEKEEQDIVYDAIIEEHDAPNSLITVSAVATILEVAMLTRVTMVIWTRPWSTYPCALNDY